MFEMVMMSQNELLHRRKKVTFTKLCSRCERRCLQCVKGRVSEAGTCSCCTMVRRKGKNMVLAMSMVGVAVVFGSLPLYFHYRNKVCAVAVCVLLCSCDTC